jgi:hypothetical protein
MADDIFLVENYHIIIDCRGCCQDHIKCKICEVHSKVVIGLRSMS